MSERSQFSLMRSRRFLPYFITQFLGAFNDNVFKQALVLAILFKIGVAADPNVLINLSALLFILPFFLFSALGGQFGEKFPKHVLIRLIKFAEIIIMLTGAASVLLGSLPMMLVVLFAMGAQSSLFGPVKYSILPLHLAERELIGGNALVEMGTFLAILGGTLFAGVLMAGEAWASWVSIAVVSLALLGFFASLAIPPTAAALPRLQLDWNILRQSARILHLGLVQQSRPVSRSLLANSWFWFLGATYLAQIPGFTRDYLGGDETVVTLILAVFSIGIAAGSLLCERLSRKTVELGLVPLGACGLTLFGLLLWGGAGFIDMQAGQLGWLQLLLQPAAWAVMVCILGLGMFGGLYIVPLYALIQARTGDSERSRVIAANNILNSLLMVISAVFAMLMLGVVGISIPQLFLVVSVLNVLVSLYLFLAVPEFTERLKVWVNQWN
ncbi:Major Facilitator Superfamily protein [Halopseudomonas litoralis]|uniref:Major Facilitator Superfamily protein n=1 Tax=Halopseudomonas litoralis TaxID=797277 RepID=A0A1H1SSG9_9GAMM|nr:MFS transporter [Halopseudomonas litoralis]SDS50871.1 Major Facilitator Superfamily protein [Halopseudomonas litoralis]